MNRNDARDRFAALLEASGVDLDSPSAADVSTVWKTMRAFATEPVEGSEPPEQEGDGLLAQYGTYDWGWGEHFELDMTRQLVFYDGDEYHGMVQLNCTFEFIPVDELRATGEESMWSFGMALDSFFEAALAMPGFATVERMQPAPTRLRIEYGNV